MILWVKRAAALFCALIFTGLFFSPERNSLTAVFMVSNLIWAMSDRMPRSAARFFYPAMLLGNTLFSAYLAIAAVSSVFPILIAASSLAAWNMEAFLLRWGKVPLDVQRRYLRQLSIMIALGLIAELSSSALAGHLSFGFFWALSFTLAGVVLLLRLISRALEKPG